MPKLYSQALQPMRIQARPGSLAEKRYYKKSALPNPFPVPSDKGAIASGITPNVLEDLIFHGGKVVPQMEYQNIYLGSDDSWKQSDIDNIDASINLAMRDRRLNNVMVQYFPGATLSCDVRESFILDEAKPAVLDEPDVQDVVRRMFDSNLLAKSDLDTTIFNLILPSGTVLKLANSSSTNGLGGFHGSMHFKDSSGVKRTIYYSANVYSERVSGGKVNGIIAFNKPWKNVVGTLYHEINEFRTDADVNDAIIHNSNEFIGWNSRTGREVGDQPIFAADALNQVFKEVKAATGTKRIPVQFMFSNAVHGAEGPIDEPHA